MYWALGRGEEAGEAVRGYRCGKTCIVLNCRAAVGSSRLVYVPFGRWRSLGVKVTPLVRDVLLSPLHAVLRLAYLVPLIVQPLGRVDTCLLEPGDTTFEAATREPSRPVLASPSARLYRHARSSLRTTRDFLP
jgi:hypothetical protein